MNKKALSERDICTKFITPALVSSGWDIDSQVREEVSFTDGRIYVRGKLHARGTQKRADYVLYYRPNIPIAIIEAKDNNHTVAAGLQQALGYAQTLDIPFVFSSNGDGFRFHDRTATGQDIETDLALADFPSAEQLWTKYKALKGISESAAPIVAQDYFTDGSSRAPRYYQQIAINRTVEAVARATGPNRHLLVMATGTGKTYTAFQIIYRLWKSGLKKRILFLADRTALVDQTVRGDFRHFKEAMTVIKNKQIDTAYNVYLALYQGLSDNKNSDSDAYRQFSPGFFDLVVVDECHRGSAREDSKWLEILDYFSSATHLGLTATPKETTTVSSSEYFGDPLYTYSLKQGIDDGFLAPYKVVKVTLDIDAEGWRPPKGFLDKDRQPVEDRIYNRTDFDKSIVVEELLLSKDDLLVVEGNGSRDQVGRIARWDGSVTPTGIVGLMTCSPAMKTRYPSMITAPNSPVSWSSLCPSPVSPLHLRLSNGPTCSNGSRGTKNAVSLESPNYATPPANRMPPIWSRKTATFSSVPSSV